MIAAIECFARCKAGFDADETAPETKKAFTEIAAFFDKHLVR